MPPSIVERVSYAGDMTPDSDDDALTWDGDDAARPMRPVRKDATQTSGPESAPRSAPEPTRATESRESDEDAVVDGSLVEERPPLSTAMLLTLGVVGGVYLLYSIGWVVGGLRLKPLANFFVADAMFLPWFVLAVAAPALWFLASWVLTRGRAAWIRVGLLLLGVVLLVPWPFVTVGAIGS